MENTKQFKDMIDIQKFEDLFEDLTGHSGNIYHAINKWSDAKSSNPSLVKMFKDSLIIGVPVEQVFIDESFLYQNNIPDIFQEVFAPLRERVNAINKSYGMFCRTDEYKEHDKNTLHYGQFMRDWRSISLSFLDGSIESRNVYNGIRMQPQEPYYRYLNRVIKKLFGKESLEASEYNTLLTRLSLFKQNIALKEENENILCLSIHPKDYLTASKGNSWSSCYSIDRDYYGDYASSVSSTLASRDTVVAYVVPKKEYDKMQEDDMYTPDKLWRSFVLVNPQQMLLMKGYPNQSISMFKQISTLIKKISETPYIFTSGDGLYPFIESSSAYLDVTNASKEEHRTGSWYRIPDFNQTSEFRYFEFATDPFYWDTGEEVDFDASGTDAVFSWQTLETCDCCEAHLHPEDACYDDETGYTYCNDCMEEVLLEREEREREEEEREEEEEAEREMEFRREYEENSMEVNLPF